MHSPPPTARLAYRDWDHGDVDALIDMYSREEVFRFLGSSPEAVVDPDVARVRIDRWSGRGAFSGVWAVTTQAEATRPIGTILLVPLTLSAYGSSSGVFEIGWHFHPDAWGRGYATEAGQAMIDRARRAGLSEVRAVLYAENLQSRRVCERLGMTYAGSTDEWYGVTLEEYVLAL